MSLNIDFSGDQQEENDQGVSPKAMGGTELSRKWLFDRLDPELRDYFQFISYKKCLFF